MFNFLWHVRWTSQDDSFDINLIENDLDGDILQIIINWTNNIDNNKQSDNFSESALYKNI